MNIKTTFTIILLFCTTLVNAQSVTNGLAAAYYFNNSSTDSLMNSVNTSQVGTFPDDATITMPDATFQQSRKPTKVAGRSNQSNTAFTFHSLSIPPFGPGAPQEASTAINIPSTGITNVEYTFALWMRIAGLPYSGQWEILLSIGGQAGDQVVSLTDAGLRVHSYYVSGYPPYGTSVAIAAGSINLDEWTHVVSRRTMDSLFLYINGHKISSALAQDINGVGTGAMYGGTTARIGCRFNDTFGYDGDLDEVKIYNRALSSAEILQEYNAGVVTAITGSTKEDLLVGVYPNPAQDVLHVDLSKIEAPLEYIKIIDIQGLEQMQVNNPLQTEQLDINTTALGKGCYILQLKTANKIYTRRFIK